MGVTCPGLYRGNRARRRLVCLSRGPEALALRLALLGAVLGTEGVNSVPYAQTGPGVQTTVDRQPKPRASFVSSLAGAGLVVVGAIAVPRLLR